MINEGGRAQVALSMDASLQNRAARKTGSCAHEDCDSFQRVFSPPLDRRVTRVPVQRFPYCRKCGALKNVSSDKAKLLGWFTNLLHRINYNIALSHGKLTQAQQRLIISEIERVQDFEDRYQMTRAAQLDIFFVAIHKIRPDLPFWVLERAATPEPPPKEEEVRRQPAWVQYWEWLKKKRAREAAAAAGAGRKK